MQTNAPETMGVIYRLQLSQLHPHPQNPFSIRDDQAMLDLIQSVQSHGVLVPAIVRPRPDGEYEIIAGHRRKHASELAGLDFMPVVVLDLNDDEAIIQLVDSKEILSLLRYSSNNLNQLTKRVHETGRIYDADLEDIHRSQDRIWTAVEKVVATLAKL